MSELSGDNLRIFKTALRYYSALTGIAVSDDINDIAKDVLLTQSITTIMCQIYREEIREKYFGWEKEEGCICDD